MKMIRSLLAALLLIVAPTAMAGKHAYPEFRPVLAHEAREILKKYGMPVSDNRDNPWFSISGTPGRYFIGLYRSNEIPQQAILDIVQLCMNFYAQREKKEQFNVSVYTETEEQWRKSLIFLGLGPARIKPFFELRIGEKK